MPSPAVLLLLSVFTFSNVLFLLRAAASPGVAIGCSLLLIAAVALLYRNVRTEALGRRWVIGVVASALAVCVVGGAGHLMFTTEDWQVRDAVLHDLMRPAWPVVYGSGASSQVLRAPFGFYMLPATVGTLFGLGAAHFAVLLQDAALLAAVLLIFAQEFATRRTRIIGLIAIGLFSGWDVVGQGTMAIGTVVHGTPYLGDLHIERWGGLEFSSFVTDLFWAPNHSLPPLAFAGLYLLWRRGALGSPALALFAGLSLLWSPLAVMGMAPIVGFALIRDVQRGRLKRVEFGIGASAIVGIAPILLFLQLDSHAVVSGFLFSDPEFPLQYLLLLAFEIGPITYLLLRSGLGVSGASRLELAMIIGLLLLIPTYSLGPSNDFVMRASIAPLALAAVFVARRLADSVEVRRTAAVRTIAVVLAIGAVTPALQVVRAFLHPRSAPVTLPVPQAWAASIYRNQPMDTYLARPESLRTFRAVLKPVAEPVTGVARYP